MLIDQRGHRAGITDIQVGARQTPALHTRGSRAQQFTAQLTASTCNQHFTHHVIPRLGAFSQTFTQQVSVLGSRDNAQTFAAQYNIIRLQEHAGPASLAGLPVAPAFYAQEPHLPRS